ncbi:MAG: FtsW/RodA/SpoVE family cell cycle protein [Planctomycetota bacterium]|nr:FtsW/RodA/SpoVE family cell cycle protein [Planctomycetota bacterium]
MPLDPAVEGARFIGAVILLLAIGMFFHYSASSYRSSVTDLNSTSMWLKQLKGYGLGVLLFAAGYLISPRRWMDTYWLPLWGGVVLLLVATLWSPLGRELNDAHRWLDLGVRFQPSELAKFCIPISTIALTGMMRYRGIFGRPITVRSGSLIAAALVGIPFAMIFVQPDFGSALFILVLGAIPLLRWLKLCWYCCLLMLPVALVNMNAVIDRWGEMQQRFMAVHSPESVPQVWAGLQGIGSGGLWGKGIGMGSSKTLFVPSEYSDFIFSVYAEETGFIGVLCLATLYLLVLIFGWRLSRAVEDADLACLVRVVTIAITGQAAINLLVNVALFPTKGIPLPFFSHGSTGLAVFMGMTGVVMAISRSRVRQVVSVT